MKRQAVAKVVTVKAPTGGLNARDAIADMEPEDAVILENWFPGTASVDIRKGSVAAATGLPGWVETLASYSSAGITKLFGASGNAVYDVTASGAVGAAVVSGMSNNRWQWVMFGNAGGERLVMCNGVDPVLNYDGSAWTQITNASVPISITGFDPHNAINVEVYKSRLWFVEKNTMNAWYLPLQSFGGVAQQLNLSSLFKLGGYLMATIPFSVDNGQTVNDYFAFVTSEGEVAVYQGSDPSFAATFGIVGIYRIGRPIGRRCYMRMGSDAVIISADGFYPLSSYLLTDRKQNLAFSFKVTNAVQNDVASYSGNFGWQPLLYAIGNKLIFNVPQIESNTQYQYVMNQITGAWCVFKGWNAACFALFNDKLFYGGNQTVYQADTGNSDAGADIVAIAKPAFNVFGAQGQQKKFNMARPVFNADGNINVALALCIDYGDSNPTSTPSYSQNVGSPWNTSPWNTSPWTSPQAIKKSWQTLTGVGYAATIKMKAAANNLSVQWTSTDFAFEPGGTL